MGKKQLTKQGESLQTLVRLSNPVDNRRIDYVNNGRLENEPTLTVLSA